MDKLRGSLLLTGANGGLGSAFVTNLLKSPYAHEYRALYLVRNPSAANDLEGVLRKAQKTHRYEILPIDLGSLESVRGVASQLNARIVNGSLEPIRALVLNAAWQDASMESLKPRFFTEDGYESHFAINYLANFLFVLLALQGMDKLYGRIIITSSFAHDSFDRRNKEAGYFKGKEYKIMYPDTETLAKGIEYKDHGWKAGMRRYGASKLLMVLFMYELQRRIDSDPELSEICVVSLDPGVMAGTGLARRSPLLIQFILSYVIYFLQIVSIWFSPNGTLRTVIKSGTDLLMCCFDERNLGEYPKAAFLNGSERAEPSKESRDRKKQKKLWMDSLKLARLRDGDTVLKNWQ